MTNTENAHRTTSIVARRADCYNLHNRTMNPADPASHERVNPARDYGSDTDEVVFVERTKGGKTVAVIGSGSWGLTPGDRISAFRHDTGTGGSELGGGRVVAIWSGAEGMTGSVDATRCDLYYAI